MILLSGIIILAISRASRAPLSPLPASGEGQFAKQNGVGWWHLAAIILIAADPILASASFNPASDPAWLTFTPPSIQWLQAQDGDWRYITLDDQTQPYPQLFNANMTLRDGLDDVRGYESIIPRHYMDFMQELTLQLQRDFNRIAPIYRYYDPAMIFEYQAALNDPRLDWLNIRYVITHTNADLAPDGLSLAYEDQAVRIWENHEYAPRAFLIEAGSDQLPTSAYTAVPITSATVREKFHGCLPCRPRPSRDQ
jgi:hypothetical protein